MNPALKKEIDRLLALFESHGRPLTPKPMESDEPFHLMEKTTNIVLEPDVKDFYRFFGGRDAAEILTVEIAGPTLLMFRDLLGATNDEWDGTGPRRPATTYDVPPRDPRIQPDVSSHPGWFPLGRVQLGATSVMYDDAPTPLGRKGQIISFEHDPDEVFFVADSFVDYLRVSNDLLESEWQELFPDD